MSLRLRIEQSVVQKFQREARKWFPLEFFAGLLSANSDRFHIVSLWIPEDLRQYSTADWVDVPHEKWTEDAYDYAEERGLIVSGSIHSHPYEYKDCAGGFEGRSEPAPSQGDWQMGWSNICGIITVAQQKNKSLRTRYAFYGPAVPVETTILKAS